MLAMVCVCLLLQLIIVFAQNRKAPKQVLAKEWRRKCSSC